MENEKTNDKQAKQTASKPKSVTEKSVKYDPMDGPKGRTILFISSSALIIAIISLAVWGWIYFRWDSVRDETTEVLNKAQQQYIQQNETLQSIKTKVDQALILYEQQKMILEKQAERILNLSQQPGPITQQQILDEITHLLKLAQLNLFYQQDMNTSRNLVDTALDRVNTLESGQAESVKNMLTQLQTELGATHKVDTSQLLAELNNISQQIPHLPLANVVGKLEQQATEIQSDGSWGQALQSNVQKLANVVSIRRHDQAIKPMISAEERRQIDFHLQTLIQQAQWGLLHRDKQVYQTSLNQVINLLQLYYKVNNIATRNVISELNSVNQYNIAPVLPDLSRVINELEKVEK